VTQIAGILLHVRFISIILIWDTMKKYFALLPALFFCAVYCLLMTTPAMAQITLAQNQKTSYVIALANDAIPAEKTAAEQLQKYLQQVTGATFSIQPETAVKPDAPQILVGAGQRVGVLLPRQAGSTPGSDGIVIQSVGQNLILSGDRPRGALYAVFQFLEDEIGCRWWTPTESTIPTKSTLIIQPQNLVYASPFSYREHYTTSVQSDPVFATIMRENGHFQTQSEEWGGHYNILGFVHTFNDLLPVKKYFADHPEWYPDPENGNLPCTANSKMPDDEQIDPDLSNPQVVEEVTKNALEWIEKNPQAGYISVSQNDNTGGYCRCSQCAALTAAEGSPSGPLIKFVNQVAAKIHQQYPDFLVETLAYNYSENPPKTIRPAQNVIVRLAPINTDYGHPINSDWNKATRDKVLAWADISPQLFIWNYVTNFNGNMLPHPNWDGLAKDLRFFADNKVTGIFQQGDNYTNGVGDFVQLRAWLIGKLMWNPNLDQSKLTDEFLQGYYGEAAPHLRQYLDLITKSFESKNVKLSTKNSDFSFFTLDVMNQSMQLFDKAENAVKADKVLTERVRRERLSLELARLYRFDSLQKIAADTNQILSGEPDPNRAMREFIASAKHFGVQKFTESESFEARIPSLLAMFTPKVELPKFAQEFPAGDVIDLQPEQFTLYQKGTLTNLEKDADTISGKAASMVGATNEWAIQASLGRALDSIGESKWHIYALARADVKVGETPGDVAFQSGIYDDANRQTIFRTDVPSRQVTGAKYQRIDLGSHVLNSGMLLWFAPLKDLAINKIYIERVILIREKP
jgi:hypothetical protein